MRRYEDAFNYTLPWRMPTILRLDGRAFHKLTRPLAKPWDDGFIDAMQRTAIDLCQEIEGARLAYVQSDEISVLLVDYNKLASQPWFGKRVQKMCSISASIAANSFNDNAFMDEKDLDWAEFDSRAFVLPESEVTNYFISRQQDAARNSVQMLAREHFSHRGCHGLNNSQLQDKLMKEKKINWNDLPVEKRRGACIYYVPPNGDPRAGDQVGKHGWKIDHNIPLFTASRDYIETRLEVEE